jgi:hypothetical protein
MSLILEEVCLMGTQDCPLAMGQDYNVVVRSKQSCWVAGEWGWVTRI